MAAAGLEALYYMVQHTAPTTERKAVVNHVGLQCAHRLCKDRTHIPNEGRPRKGTPFHNSKSERKQSPEVADRRKPLVQSLQRQNRRLAVVLFFFLYICETK